MSTTEFGAKTELRVASTVFREVRGWPFDCVALRVGLARHRTFGFIALSTGGCRIHRYPNTARPRLFLPPLPSLSNLIEGFRKSSALNAMNCVTVL